MSMCIRLCLCLWLISTVETLENLALGKEAQMSSQRSDDDANAAVDGNTAQSESSGTCALTDLRGLEAWWRVDLNGTFAVSQLTVYLLDKNIFRFRFYSVHVTDDLDNWKSSVPCAKDHETAGGPSTSVVRMNCDGKGRYVTIWLNRPLECEPHENDNFCDILQLCEVRIFGCQPGNYSQNCNMMCPVNCRDDICAIDDGKCYNCKDGYLGDNCDQACQAGKFGRECKSTCNGFCRNGATCSNVNGFCQDGCMDGYEGNFCNKTCSNRTFGLECRENCGSCLENEPCHHTTGVCDSGCDNGWKGTYCNISCDQGEYGKNCQNNCSKNCFNETRCDRFTGYCENGCKPGWTGDNCDNVCGEFSYGQNCLKECGNCNNNATCNNVDGLCVSGCNKGWEGELCKTVCDNYTFGHNCSQNCSRNCRNEETCNRFTGICDSGCDKGSRGIYCNESCAYGTYGYDCLMTCSGNCKNNQTCDPVSGVCSEGCRAGWKGDNCNITCEDGEYGENCLNKCGNCYNSTTCNKENGECDQGCAVGYKDSMCNTSCKAGEFGRNCQYNCSGNCVNNEVCDWKTGGCPNGCARGWQGSLCNTSCTPGTFGFGCNETCGGNCLNNETCYVSNGTCPSGCASGWLGDTCKTECPNGRYGLQCKGNCSDNCQSPCNKVTGQCDTGCNGGWGGIFCNQSCELGTYGPNCEYNCSGNCRGNGTCSIYNGSCPHGCDNGWMDPLCSTVCQSGMYGADCVYTCGGCVNGTACDIITGACKGGCMDGYFGQLCKKNGSKEEAQLMGEPKTSAAGIAAGVSVSILIFVAVIVILFLIRRRRMKGSESRQNLSQPLAIMKTVYENVSFRHKSDVNRHSTVTYDKNEEDVVDTEDEESRDAEEDHPKSGSVYYNISKFVDDIPLTDLKETIMKKSSEENKKFKEEYCVLPKGLIDKCDAAKLPGNVTKNRYKTTLAYDHSRIVLQSKSPDGHDYINANYIDGVLSKKKYIASQGPRVSTFRDHWCMIWQEHIEKIVMLTNLEEKGKKKCDQYWPDIDSPLTAGEFSVSLLAHQTYASYTIRKFKVTQSETNESRKVTHFHFTTWPDHGVPDSLELVLFHKRVNSLRTKGPILVHCSAGIGRTGTYIALDAVTESCTEAGKINVFEYVRAMRRNRVGMIQTVNQYIAVHWCVFEHLRTVAYNISKDTFADDVKVKESQNQQRYQEEFQIIEAMKPDYDKSVYTVGMLEKNKTKNVTEDILPVERYSAFIPSNVKDQKGYINAVYVSSFTDPHGFIVTQIPTRDTDADFINLLIDHYITTVVVLITDGEDIENWSWLPEVKMNSRRGQIKVNLNFKTTRVSDIGERRIKLKRKSMEKSIQMFSTQCLDRNDISKADLSRLVKLVSMIKSDNDNTGQRIALLSRDGAAGCALFLTLYNAIEQMQMDGEVDIFTIMRRLKVRRPQLCSSLAEYKMCYQVVADYIIETSVYANS